MMNYLEYKDFIKSEIICKTGTYPDFEDQVRLEDSLQTAEYQRSMKQGPTIIRTAGPSPVLPFIHQTVDPTSCSVVVF